MYLYALMGGVFHELVHDAGNWQTGDRLRLEVATVDAGTARLAVYRNGGLVFSHDETEDLIGGGRRGLGIGSDPALALDDWRGGRVDQTPPGPPSEPGPSLVGEDGFNHLDGELGIVWEINPFWGAGLVVRAGEARALGSGGAYWMGNDFGPDHYSEIRDKWWDRSVAGGDGAGEWIGYGLLCCRGQAGRGVSLRIDGRSLP